MPNLPKLFEFRIFLILASIALAVYLFTIFGTIFTFFSDVLLLVILSWLLAFVLEPLVQQISQRTKLSRLPAAVVIYLAMAGGAAVAIWVVLPTTMAQLSQLATVAPEYFQNDSFWAQRAQTFLATTLSNSLSLASGLASTAASMLLIFILSFYFLVSKNEISKFIKDVVPDNYEQDYVFIEKVFSTTFASFLRVQITLGLVLGIVVLGTLLILRVNFALSTAVFAALLAMVPVVGPILMLVPVILATLTVSVQKLIISLAIVILASQLVYNLLAPKLLGSALRIHPIIVLLSFVVGYKIAGTWGAIFAVPVAASLAIVSKEMLKYWKEEADK